MKANSKATSGSKKAKTRSDKLEKHEERFLSAFENMLEGVQILGHDWRYLYLNPAAEIHNRRPNQELLGNTYMDMWPGIEATHVFSVIKSCLEERIPVQLENRFVYPDGKVGWFNLSIQPIPEGILILSFDITDRIKAEAQSNQMQRLYAALSQVNQTIVRVKDRETLYQSICDVAVQYGEFSLAWIGLLDEMTGAIRPVAANGLDVNHWTFPITNIHTGPLSDGLIARAIRTSRVVTTEDIQSNEGLQVLHDLSHEHGFHASAVIPFRLRGKVIGALTLVSPDSGLFKEVDEIHLLDEMGLDISFALDTMQTQAERQQAEEALRVSEEKFKTLFEIAPVGISLLDKDRGLLNANKMLEKITHITEDGLQAGAYRNRKYLRADETPMPPDELASARALKEGQPVYNLVNGIVTENDGIIWTQVSAAPLDLADAKVVVVTEDITGRKRAEQTLQMSERTAHQMADSLRMVNEISTKITSGLDLERLLQALYEECQRIGDTDQFYVALYDDASEMLSFPFNYENGQRSLIASRRNRTVSGFTEYILEHHRTLHIPDTFELPPEGDLNRKADDPTRSYIGVPLMIKDRVVGVLSMQSHAINAYTPEQIHTLELLATQAAIAIHNAQLFEQAQQEIIERRQAQVKLRAQTERLDLATRSAGIGIWDWDVQKNKLIWDERMYALYGIKPGDFGGAYEAWLNGLHPDDRDRNDELTSQAFRGEREFDTDFRVLWPDGSIHWLKASGRVFWDQDRQPLRMVGINYDITERKQVEQQLLEGEERYRRIVETAREGMITFDTDWRVSFANAHIARILGYDQHEMLGMHIDEFVFEHDRLDNEKRKFLLEQGTSDSREAIYRTKGGAPVWLLLSTTSIREDGTFAGVLIMATDITERKQAEEKLRRSEALYRQAIEVSGAVPYLQSYSETGTSVQYDFIGEGIRQITGYGPEEFNDKLWDSLALERVLVEELVGYSWSEAIRRVRSGENSTWKCEHRIQARDGKIRWVFEAAVELRDENGVSHGSIGLFQDITGRKQAEEELLNINVQLEERVAERTAELNRTNAELERASQAKGEFLATMSHELRSPLNSILGLSESLLEQRRGSLNESQQRSLQIVESSGQHLLSLINDILDLSKMEAGKFDCYPEIIAIDDICNSSLAFVKAQASRKLIQVMYINKTGISKCSADPRRIKQILINLLTNAVKFTPERGHVTLQISAEPDQNLLQISVIDDGIGIAQKDLVRLFQPFVQVESRLNRSYEGTGLGLAMVQKLTDLHGGSVEVESEPGRGSRFTINLPWIKEMFMEQASRSGEGAAAAGADYEPAWAKEQQPRGSILLAEDNPANILTIAEYLQGYGYEVAVAHNGLEVLELVEIKNPDIILMDIQMPAMDGLEATGRLRSDPRFATTPIIALTALAMPGDRERCLAAGASEYMSKPVSLKILRQTIESFL